MSQIYVWDKFIRLFHWSLVTLFVVSYVTGDEQELVHTWSGYMITALVLARFVWGFVGSKYARFSQFVQNPKNTIRYLQQIIFGQPKRYIGHNPAGGVMVIALLFTLAMTTLSGMKLLALEEGKGPFAQNTRIAFIESTYADDDEHEEHEEDDEEEYARSIEPEYEQSEEKEEFWEETHEFFVNLMLVLIVLHVIGIFVASKQHNESLVAAMLTGKKRSD